MDEITHRSIQDEMTSSNIANSGDAEDVKSSEIRREEPRPGSDGISPTVISPEINLKSPEFNIMLRSKDEIIEAKKEQIEDMKAMYMQILKSKDDMLNSKDEELKEIRSAMDTVVKQNEILVHQNVFLTRLLTGPKEERPEAKDDVSSHDFTDVTEVTSETDDRASDPEPVPTAAHETPMAEEGGQRNDRATPDPYVVASDHLEANPVMPEQPIAPA